MNDIGSALYHYVIESMFMSVLCTIWYLLLNLAHTLTQSNLLHWKRLPTILHSLWLYWPSSTVHLISFAYSPRSHKVYSAISASTSDSWCPPFSSIAFPLIQWHEMCVLVCVNQFAVLLSVSMCKRNYTKRAVLHVAP